MTETTGKEEKRLGAFDFVESVSTSKKELVLNTDDPVQSEKAYDAFVTIKALSYHQDTILFANEMNLRWLLYKDAQYRFFLNTLRARKRFAKWAKTPKDEEIEAITQVYNVNRTVAFQYHALMTEEQRRAIVAKTYKGGDKK